MRGQEVHSGSALELAASLLFLSCPVLSYPVTYCPGLSIRVQSSQTLPGPALSIPVLASPVLSSPLSSSPRLLYLCKKPTSIDQVENGYTGWLADALYWLFRCCSCLVLPCPILSRIVKACRSESSPVQSCSAQLCPVLF